MLKICRGTSYGGPILMSVALTHHQGNFCLQQMETITANHDQSKCREQLIPRCLAPAHKAQGLFQEE